MRKLRGVARTAQQLAVRPVRAAVGDVGRTGTDAGSRLSWHRVPVRTHQVRETACLKSSALRKPSALLATGLITLLFPSHLALLCPVSMNAPVSGHHRSTAVASCCTSGVPESARQVRNFQRAWPIWCESAPVRARASRARAGPVRAVARYVWAVQPLRGRAAVGTLSRRRHARRGDTYAAADLDHPGDEHREQTRQRNFQQARSVILHRRGRPQDQRLHGKCREPILFRATVRNSPPPGLGCA